MPLNNDVRLKTKASAYYIIFKGTSSTGVTNPLQVDCAGAGCRGCGPGGTAAKASQPFLFLWHFVAFGVADQSILLIKKGTRLGL